MLTSSKRRASSLGNHPNPLTRRTSVPYARTSAGDAAALAAPAAVRVTGGRLASSDAQRWRRTRPGRVGRSRAVDSAREPRGPVRCSFSIPMHATGARFIYRVPPPVHDLYTGYRSRCTICIPGTAAGARFISRVPQPVLDLYTGYRGRCSFCIPVDATGARFVSREPKPQPVHDLCAGVSRHH